ncbi:MAG: STAS domain-containing protein [Phycisphaerales bacterium]
MFQVRKVEDASFDGVVMRLEGNCDLVGGGVLEQKLTFLSAGRPQRVVFDLETLEFIGSFGIGQLVMFNKGLKVNGGKVALARVSDGIHQALKFSRLTDMFIVHPTVDEAKAALAAV